MNVAPERYLPLFDEALRLAAELWARSHQGGRPTSEPQALDIDVRIAVQALSFASASSNVIIATTNAKHLSRFVAARHWTEMIPL